MKIDRPYFKHYARESMRGRKPSVYWVSFIFILISGILSNLDVTIQLNNMECERAARWPVLSVIMLLVSTFAGYLPFRKRDIR